jgi:large subunit ribosomal protein L5
MNPMQEVRIEKVTLNIGTGGPGELLDKAMKLLNTITSAKPVPTKSKKRIPTWGIRPGLQIGCKVTIRKKKAEELLKRLLVAKENRLLPSNIDNTGNLSFGLQEYIDIPDVEYDISIGIIGLEVAVTLEKPGYRIKKRQLQKKKIPHKHQVTKEEAIKFMEKKFNVSFKEEE